MALSQSHSHPVRPKPQRPLVTMKVTGAPREVSWQHSHGPYLHLRKTPPGCSALQQPEDHHKKRRRCESLVVLTLGLSQPYLHHVVKRHNIHRPSQKRQQNTASAFLAHYHGSHLHLQQPRPGVECCGHAWVLRSHTLLLYCLASLIEFLGLGVLALEFNSGHRRRVVPQVKPDLFYCQQPLLPGCRALQRDRLGLGTTFRFDPIHSRSRDGFRTTFS